MIYTQRHISSILVNSNSINLYTEILLVVQIVVGLHFWELLLFCISLLFKYLFNKGKSIQTSQLAPVFKLVGRQLLKQSCS